MKRILRIAGIALVGAGMLLASACGGKAEKLMSPPEAVNLTQEARGESGYLELLDSAENFAARFAPKACALSAGQNAAVSPVSVFLALSMASECAAEPMQSEISEALGVPSPLLREKAGELYRGLNTESKNDQGLLVSKLALTDSVWLGQDVSARKGCLQNLSEMYFAHIFRADFSKDNKRANKAVQNFLKEQTNGVLDGKISLSESTRVALINSLYFKDVWNFAGEDLKFSERAYIFHEGNGEVKNIKLLEGEYLSGKALETETFRGFYTETAHEYKLKFLVPKGNFTAREIFTEENLSLLRTAKYETEDETYLYRTRCIFPVFGATFQRDVKDVLKEMGVSSLFDPAACNFETLTDEALYCESLLHIAKLDVGKSGIEGAAVTANKLDASNEPELLPKIPAYLDFPVDRAFCFVLTDQYDTTLFSGIVETV